MCFSLCLVAVEYHGYLLKRATLGLWKEEVDGRNHGGERSNVDYTRSVPEEVAVMEALTKVELPLYSIECNGIHVLIEEPGGKDGSQVC